VLEMKQYLGDKFIVAKQNRQEYSGVGMHKSEQIPDAVVCPTTTQDVVNILTTCNKHNVPVIPYGAGTSLEGATAMTSRTGIVLDMSNMNKIKKINIEDMDVVVEPGVIYTELNAELKPYGLFFPNDPSPNATIGGMVATSCSGTHAVRYGTMKENVISLQAVIPNGSIIKTGQRSRKSSAGYDLTHLFIGSEGTLGVVTEVTLRLQKIPEKITAGYSVFSSVEDAANTVLQALSQGLAIGRVELLDSLQIKGVNLSLSDGHFEEKPTLFFEFSGSSGEVEHQRAVMQSLSTKNKGKFKYIEDNKERKELWAIRKNCFWHGLALAPNSDAFTTDTCVPISRLADCIKETKRDLENSKIIAPMVGHVGDGNFHLTLLYDAKNKEQEEEAELIHERLVKRAIEMHGTCTGEHGVGVGKKRFLELEFGVGAVELMRTIKKAIDPNNILNPGKVVDILPDQSQH